MLDGNEIPAGGEGRIAVNIRVGSQSQHVRKVVRVTTNDEKLANFELTVLANVSADVEILPNPVLRLDAAQSKHAPSAVTVKNHTDAPIHLSQVQASDPRVSVTLSSMTIPAQGDITVSAEIQPDAPKGVITGWLTMQTDLRSYPVIEIRLWGEAQ